MSLSTAFSQLSWKMKLAALISVLWFLFWVYSGWVGETFFWGLVFGGFPIILSWGIWIMVIHSRKDVESDLAETIPAGQKVDGSERREFDRLEYPHTNRPLLKCGEPELKIVNISEKGLKLLNDEKIELSRFIQGEAVMLCGKSVTVDGEVSWSLNNEVGLFKVMIPNSIITEDRRILTKTA